MEDAVVFAMEYLPVIFLSIDKGGHVPDDHAGAVGIGVVIDADVAPYLIEMGYLADPCPRGGRGAAAGMDQDIVLTMDIDRCVIGNLFHIQLQIVAAVKVFIHELVKGRHAAVVVEPCHEVVGHGGIDSGSVVLSFDHDGHVAAKPHVVVTHDHVHVVIGGNFLEQGDGLLSAIADIADDPQFVVGGEFNFFEHGVKFIFTAMQITHDIDRHRFSCNAMIIAQLCGFSLCIDQPLCYNRTAEKEGWYFTMGRAHEVRAAAMAKTAAMKSKLYSRYGKELYIAAKSGVPDPDMNLTLARKIKEAKSNQVPADVIKRAIDKAKGNDSTSYEEVRYEGFGPGNSTVIVDCLTDNTNRSYTNVKTAFNKCKGAKIAGAGAVSFGYEQVGLFYFPYDDEEKMLDAMMEADVDVLDLNVEDGEMMVKTAYADFSKAQDAIEKLIPDVKFDTCEVTMLANETVKLTSQEDIDAYHKLLDTLNDIDDVNKIYSNVDED